MVAGSLGLFFLSTTFSKLLVQVGVITQLADNDSHAGNAQKGTGSPAFLSQDNPSSIAGGTSSLGSDLIWEQFLALHFR
jgi:hypothetical protein